MALKYQRGTILLVRDVPDQNGGNHKNRRVVLVRDFHDTDTIFHAVAVTGTFDYPLPATSIPLPWHSDGAVGTGLRKPSVVVCEWFVTAAATDILQRGGFTPARQFAQIMQQVQAQLSAPAVPPPPALP